MPSAIDIRGSGSLAPYLFCIVFPALPVSSCARLVPMVLIKEQNCRNFRMLIDEFLGCENLALQPINLCSGDIRTASGASLARTEERRVGKEGVSPGRYRWAPFA